MKKKIAIDIDGVLTNETEGHDYALRTPNLAAIKMLKLLISLDVADVYLYTSRYPVDEAVTRQWLAKHGISQHIPIVFGKQQYDILVDDRAI